MSRILVVEDDRDIAELIAHYLQKAGHTIDVAASGTAALAARDARRRPISIVLDLMLPGMDGLLVCQALRGDAATAAIPIIMLTARGRGVGADRRPRARRRRLRHQAVQPERAGGARGGAAAPRAAARAAARPASRCDYGR